MPPKTKDAELFANDYGCGRDTQYVTESCITYPETCILDVFVIDFFCDTMIVYIFPVECDWTSNLNFLDITLLYLEPCVICDQRITKRNCVVNPSKLRLWVSELAHCSPCRRHIMGTTISKWQATLSPPHLKDEPLGS